MLTFPALGFGLGLRVPHYEAILATLPAVDWFEVLTENYLVPGGRPLHYLLRIREHYPLAMHGVSLSIGSSAPLDREYLRELKSLAQRLEPAWISDHLCWTGVAGRNTHDLLPLPYTEEALANVVERVRTVQDFLGRRILLENVSSYVAFRDSRLTEWQFLAEIAARADCLILLDVNNIYVSSVNHEFDPLEYLDGIPGGRVQQIHLAGHEDHGDYLIDTHDAAVPDPVWELYAQAVRRFGAVSTMIERDDHIPPLEELCAELAQARAVRAHPGVGRRSGGRRSQGGHCSPGGCRGIAGRVPPPRGRQPMSTLARVQREFQDYLLRGDRAVEAEVVGTVRVPLDTRLGIYAGAYRSRLAEALESNYPVLAKLLGAADFNMLASEYIAAHDSPFFSIRYYGDGLAKFLATREDYAAAPVLAELAQWEWAMTAVFDAADATALRAEDLGRIPPQRWAQLRLRWHPSVQRLTLWWNVPQLWQALSEDHERPEMALAAAPVEWLLWRENLTSYFRSLPATEAGVLDAARSGWPFGELCTLLCEELGDEEAPAQAAALLRTWIGSGLIVSAA